MPIRLRGEGKKPKKSYLVRTFSDGERKIGLGTRLSMAVITSVSVIDHIRRVYSDEWSCWQARSGREGDSDAHGG